MNATIAGLTWQSLVGRRRAWLLLILPLILIVLAFVIRLINGSDPDDGTDLLGQFALGFLVPLLGLIAGTGAIGPEIDDGSIVYLLAKPISRNTIVLSKLATAIVVVTAFAAFPTLVAGFLITGGTGNIAIGYAIGALIAGIAYCAVFLLLAIVSRNAVVIGLIYVLLWEGAVGGYVPGAQALSIQQWALVITQKVVGSHSPDAHVTDTVNSAVDLPVGIVLLVLVSVGATVYAGNRLRNLRLAGDE